MHGASHSIKCACCDCISSCHVRTLRENRLKKKHGDHEAMEHGPENRLAILPISSNILKYSISKNMKRTQRRMNSMVQLRCNFCVCESCPTGGMHWPSIFLEEPCADKVRIKEVSWNPEPAIRTEGKSYIYIYIQFF